MRSVAAVLAGFVTLSVSLYAMQGVGTADPAATVSGASCDGVYCQSQHGHARVLADLGDDEHGGCGLCHGSSRVEQPRSRHATVMGAIQAIVTLWAMLSISSDEPLWFWLTGIAMMVPAAWFGGSVATSGVRPFLERARHLV